MTLFTTHLASKQHCCHNTADSSGLISRFCKKLTYPANTYGDRKGVQQLR